MSDISGRSIMSMDDKILLNVFRHVVQFEAVFVGNNISFSGSSISAEDHSIFKNESGNGGTGFNRFRTGKSLFQQELISAIQISRKEVLKNRL